MPRTRTSQTSWLQFNYVNRHRRYYRIRKPKFNHLKRSFRFLPGEWILVTLDDGKIVDCSIEFAHLLGMVKTDIVQHAIDRFTFSGDEQGWGIKRLDLDLLQQSGRYEDVGISTPNNISLIADVWVNHISQREAHWAFCLITDKSHQRQLQGELISKHQELKRAFSKLEQQTLELEAAQNELREKNKDISELSAQTRATSALATIGEITAELTHQLNNPLAAATGASRKLNKLHESGRFEQAQTMLQLLSSALQRMKETIDDVHIIYRHSRIPVSPRVRIDIRDIVQSTFALLEQRISQMKVHVVIPENLPPIWAHKSLFQHIIVNLLDNAADAAGPKGTLEFRAIHEPEHERVCIAISDNGPGVPPHLREKIFEAFYTLKEKGSGLGLAAVKRYVERDNATIEVSDSSYGGAKFTICYQTRESQERTKQ
ncbi:MAG: hypothetical protein JXX29_15355 [Deltaproteobacteria bacterium]|nr:hypothetical protein [Deltaproteobacteria bacterium]MBN2673059.1 hypothetical protein [Deltaproteobacteria bacterium]